MPACIPTVAGVTPNTVSPHLHDSLQRLAASAQYRCPRGGWTDFRTAKALASGQPVHRLSARLVPADHVTQLVQRNLAKVSQGGQRRLIDKAELTDLGHEVAAIVARAKAKGSAE